MRGNSQSEAFLAVPLAFEGLQRGKSRRYGALDRCADWRMSGVVDNHDTAEARDQKRMHYIELGGEFVMSAINMNRVHPRLAGQQHARQLETRVGNYDASAPREALFYDRGAGQRVGVFRDIDSDIMQMRYTRQRKQGGVTGVEADLQKSSGMCHSENEISSLVQSRYIGRHVLGQSRPMVVKEISFSDRACRVDGSVYKSKHTS